MDELFEVCGRTDPIGATLSHEREYPRSPDRCGALGIRQNALVPEDGLTPDIPLGTSVGRRVVVTGMAGFSKSTFSRALSVKTGIPAIHLDVHFWKPGWVEPSEDEWREAQRDRIRWDGNGVLDH